MASAFLTQMLALIATIATGSATDPKVTAAITDLQTRLTADEGTEADQIAVITALIQKLANSTPAAGPVVATVTPKSGAIAGGDTVTITGTGFTGATAVNFGTVAGTALAVANDTSLTVVSPAQVAGKVDITVVTPAGTSAVVAADAFTYA